MAQSKYPSLFEILDRHEEFGFSKLTVEVLSTSEWRVSLSNNEMEIFAIHKEGYIPAARGAVQEVAEMFDISDCYDDEQ